MYMLVSLTVATMVVVSANANPFMTCAGKPLRGWTGHTCVVCNCDSQLPENLPEADRCAWKHLEGLRFWDNDCRKEIYKQFDVQRGMRSFGEAFHSL